MSWEQQSIVLPQHSRGCHLITSTIESQLPIQNYSVGILHLFIQHTSCGLTLNENCDRDVRTDMATALDFIVPDDHPDFLHRDEGPDDMSGHVKSTLVGASVSVPIKNGRLLLGTWQGIYLCEFRERGGRRKIVGTIQGLKK